MFYFILLNRLISSLNKRHQSLTHGVCVRIKRYNVYKLLTISWWCYLFYERFIFIMYFGRIYFYFFMVIFIDFYVLSMLRFSLYMYIS